MSTEKKSEHDKNRKDHDEKDAKHSGQIKVPDVKSGKSEKTVSKMDK